MYLLPYYMKQSIIEFIGFSVQMRAQEHNIVEGGVQAEPKQRSSLFCVSQAEKGPMWLFPVEGRMSSVQCGW